MMDDWPSKLLPDTSIASIQRPRNGFFGQVGQIKPEMSRRGINQCVDARRRQQLFFFLLRRLLSIRPPPPAAKRSSHKILIIGALKTTSTNPTHLADNKRSIYQCRRKSIRTTGLIRRMHKKMFLPATFKSLKDLTN